MPPADRWICLMYHDVLPREESGREYFAVPVDRFREHLLDIEAAGCRGVSLGEALASPAPGTVAITFDDATVSQVEHALPCLLERGMTATFFAITDRVGTPGYATWDQLRRLKASGMEVQSHTHTHPFLSELSRAQVDVEMRRSKELLDRELGQGTALLALPGGDFPKRSAMRAIADAGYRAVGTSIFGVNRIRARDGASGASARPLHVLRCTVRGDADATFIRRVLAADASLFWRFRVKETALRHLRSSLGPTRYARWRRGFLNAVRGGA